MPEFKEPVWVGMDVDAELARYEEEDRRRAKTARVRGTRDAAKSARHGGGLTHPLPLVGKEAAAPGSPLAA